MKTHMSKKLDAEGTRYYQELIGVLRWAIELGRVDILLEVSLLSSLLCLGRTLVNRSLKFVSVSSFAI